MFVGQFSERNSSVGRNAFQNFQPSIVDKSVTPGTGSGFLIENFFAQSLWITAYFALEKPCAGRKNIQSFAPALSDQYQQLTATESDWAKFSKTTFHPSPVMVGEKSSSPLGLLFAPPGFDSVSVKLAIVGRS